LKCVIDFFGYEKAKLLAIEYDNKILIPCLWNVAISWILMLQALVLQLQMAH
jgi:hypothetical protein